MMVRHQLNYLLECVCVWEGMLTDLNYCSQFTITLDSVFVIDNFNILKWDIFNKYYQFSFYNLHI